MVRKTIENQSQTLLKQQGTIHQELTDSQNEYWDNLSSINKDTDKNNDQASYLESLRHYEHISSIADHEYLKLQRMMKKPFIGKIDFVENGGEEENVYIGISSLTDHNHDFLVVDWRSPIASLFYQHSNGEQSFVHNNITSRGNVTLKRHFQYDDGYEISSYIDDSSNVYDDLLIDYLNKKEDAKLHQVIGTIQADQDLIIRKRLTKDTLIEGPAGSGKTIVAYHRIAHQLYEHRLLPFNHLRQYILGPGEEYFKQTNNVLLELGEELTTSNTITTLFEDTFTEVEELLATESSFYLSAIEGNHMPTSMLTKEDVDQAVLNKLKAISFDDIELFGVPIISGDAIKAWFNRRFVKYDHEGNCDLFFEHLRESILENRQKILENIAQNHLQLSDYPFTLMSQARLELIKRQTEIFGKLKSNLLILASDIYKDLEQVANNEIPYNNRGLFAYINTLIYSYQTHSTVKELIIDEAQDISVFDYLVLKKLFPCARFLLYGDRHQSMIYPSYDSVFNQLNVDSFKLSRSYRNTSPIAELSGKILDLDSGNTLRRHGNPVTISRPTTLDTMDLNTDLVITFSESDFELLSKRHPNVLPVYRVKGLEYKSVTILVNNLAVIESPLLRQYLYVAMTRALHSLTIVTLDEDVFKGLQEFR